jgi:hypothetical protein
LRDAFAAVPESELRLMLGENLIRFLGRDRVHLARIAERIGLSVDDIQLDAGPIASDVIASFDARGCYLRAAEGAGRIGDIDPMIKEDLLAVGVPATAGFTTSTGAPPRF